MGLSNFDFNILSVTLIKIKYLLDILKIDFFGFDKNK